MFEYLDDLITGKDKTTRYGWVKDNYGWHLWDLWNEAPVATWLQRPSTVEAICTAMDHSLSHPY